MSIKNKSDEHLSFELDKLQKMPTVPGSPSDKARSAQMNVVKAEMAKRQDIPSRA